MKLKFDRIYALLTLLCIAGFSWVFYQYLYGHNTEAISVCLLKNTTGIPCPSCGSTRAVMHLLDGHFRHALSINPLGILTFTLLLLLPFWLLYDLLNGKRSLLVTYRRMESSVRHRYVSWILLILISANWFWNISKHL